MDVETILLLDAHRQLGEEPPLRDVEPAARPFDRGLGLGVHGFGGGATALS